MSTFQIEGADARILRWTFRAAFVLVVLSLTLFVTELSAEASHRAVEDCVSCRSWNWLCRFGNYLAGCSRGH